MFSNVKYQLNFETIEDAMDISRMLDSFRIENEFVADVASVIVPVKFLEEALSIIDEMDYTQDYN